MISSTLFCNTNTHSDGWTRLLSSVVFVWRHHPPLTSSSQLQPRSWVRAASESDAGDGDVTSSGMLGWCGGSLSMAFKLPYVPLFGAGFKPNRSETGRRNNQKCTEKVQLSANTWECGWLLKSGLFCLILKGKFTPKQRNVQLVVLKASKNSNVSFHKSWPSYQR